ncbi:hypothetical protein THAOC_12088 [Thalassiosira oceanica]|uniref:Uncharacterized protein n=1 Tax=Thalassiosira oceanica TaxID=159749 RepID=K0SKU0_THAOC|nr:hypothetical protein THAOC_12088 [Thalassiosira oceanica]|eukprot:EJK66938.1 hypothetical protein THAOC_12088 [Thalassiosira oceanica]
MMPETAILPAKRGDVGSVGVHPCVEGGRIRQYTASDGAPMVYGVEAFECEGKMECVLRGRATGLHHEALAVEGRIRLECEADDHAKRWKGWPFLCGGRHPAFYEQFTTLREKARDILACCQGRV